MEMNDSIDVSEIEQMEMLFYGLNRVYFEDVYCWREESTLTTDVNVIIV